MGQFASSLVLRPPRRDYSDSELGNRLSFFDGSWTTRVPVRFTNSRSQSIVGSYYPSPGPAPDRPAVIYLHGNASSQVEGTFLTSILCPQGIGVLCIDTNGCGRSDGATISLGYHERADVAAALSYLRTSHRIGPIALWGRSMGAAIALWCAIDQMDIQAIIVDSGYRSIRRIAADHVGTSLIVAGIVRLAFPILDRYVRKYGGFSMDDVNVGDLAKAKVPALFVHGHGDSLIYPAQTREIFALYGGKQKYFATANGEHCSNRPGDVRAIELAFLLNVFAIEGDPHTDIGEGEADDHGAEHFENVYRMLRKMR